MERHTLFATDFTDSGNRHHGTDLIIGIHDRHQTGIRANGIRDLLRIDHPILMYGQQFHLKPLLFQLSKRVQNGMMLLLPPQNAAPDYPIRFRPT